MDFLDATGFLIACLCGLAIWGFAIWQAIRRLQTKLGPDAKPTVWTYVNELGGYLIVGILILFGLAGSLLQRLSS